MMNGTSHHKELFGGNIGTLSRRDRMMFRAGWTLGSAECVKFIDAEFPSEPSKDSPERNGH